MNRLCCWLFAIYLLVPNPAQAKIGQLSSATAAGALAVVPYLTEHGTNRITLVTLTNGSDSWQALHLTFLSADAWRPIDSNCTLSPNETTYAIFEASSVSGSARVTMECTNFLNLDQNVVTLYPFGNRGLMVVALEDPTLPANTHRTVTNNVLITDFVVIDFDQGYAFSAPGYHIQGLAGGDGDRLYQFDGTEYAPLSGTIATSYIAPDADTKVELLLFTLDGRIGDGPGILARMGGVAYDDDENPVSGFFNVDCLTLINLEDVFGLNVRREYGGHLVGNVVLQAHSTRRSDTIELLPGTGDGNGLRTPPVHGWIIHTTGKLGDVLGSGNRSAGKAAWARLLLTAYDPLPGVGGDTTALDARVYH